VVDQHGLLVFGVNGVDATPLRDLTVDPNVRDARAGFAVRTEADDLFTGARRFVAAAPVAGLGWSVLVGESPASSTERLSHALDGLLALRLALLTLLLGGGVLLSRTTLRQQEIALSDLRKLNKSKSDFVSVVSHEFRTPLTGIQGFSEMIRDEELTMAEAKDFANDINKDAHRLSRMITELLDLDRMESGRMTQNRERVDLGALATDAVEHQRHTASRHRFAMELDPSLHEIWADRDRITQVLTNLISNAVKYSPDGGTITVGTSRLDDAAHCWVRDEGMGIPAESLEEVFERYSRLETTKTRSIQGTGLGLPIVREICQMHGGRAWAESTLTKGSTFHITLPIDQRSTR
jgi:signal transduction histidine kinase